MTEPVELDHSELRHLCRALDSAQDVIRNRLRRQRMSVALRQSLVEELAKLGLLEEKLTEMQPAAQKSAA